MRPWLFIAMFLLIMSKSLALGVGPVQAYRIFEPGRTEQISFTIFGSGTVNVSARGELARFIEFPRRTYDVEGTRATFYTVTMPEELPPGLHRAEIVVTEVPERTGATVQAAVSAVHKLTMLVPYSEPYAEARMVVEGYEDRALIKVYVYNFHDSEIRVAGTVFVNSMKIDLLEQPCGPMEEIMLSETVELAPGKYEAQAEIAYEGRSIALSAPFIVGRKHISIRSITVDPFIPGDFARIRAVLDNEWPAAINAHAELTIMTDNQLIDTVKSETFSIEKEKELALYWNTEGMALGEYAGELQVLYDGLVTSGDFGIAISEPEKRRSPLLVWAMLAFLAVILFVWRRKLFKRSFHS